MSFSDKIENNYDLKDYSKSGKNSNNINKIYFKDNENINDHRVSYHLDESFDLKIDNNNQLNKISLHDMNNNSKELPFERLMKRKFFKRNKTELFQKYKQMKIKRQEKSIKMKNESSKKKPITRKAKSIYIEENLIRSSLNNMNEEENLIKRVLRKAKSELKEIEEDTLINFAKDHVNENEKRINKHDKLINNRKNTEVSSNNLIKQGEFISDYLITEINKSIDSR
jgi:hypothetical protein